LGARVVPGSARDGGGIQREAEGEGRRQADGAGRLQGRKGRGPIEEGPRRPLEGSGEGRGDHEGTTGRERGSLQV